MAHTVLAFEENTVALQTKPQYMQCLSDTSFLNRYDVFFLDVWGTLSDGIKFSPGAIHFLNQVLANGKRFVFVSNASRPSKEAREGYPKKGLPDYGNNLMVVTAGQTCVDDILTNRHGKLFYAYGKPVPLPEGYNYTTNLDDANAVIAAMCNTLSADGIAPHQDFLEKIHAKNLPMICSNADQWVYEGNQLFMCAGFVARQYEAMGGNVTYYGKPHVRMFDDAHKLCGLDVPKNKILMVGDSFETDIQGASRYGIDSCVVLSGLYAKTPDLTPEEWIQQQAQMYNGVLPTCWAHCVS